MAIRKKHAHITDKNKDPQVIKKKKFRHWRKKDQNILQEKMDKNYRQISTRNGTQTQ